MRDDYRRIRVVIAQPHLNDLNVRAPHGLVVPESNHAVDMGPIKYSARYQSQKIGAGMRRRVRMQHGPNATQGGFYLDFHRTYL